jgi:transcriptional regulator with XRE-family HTH domain
MDYSMIVLTLEARRVLGLNQATLAALLGSSRRTMQRLDSGKASLTSEQLSRLAAEVYPHDTALAAKLANAAGTTLEALGLAKLMPAPATPPAPQPPPPYLTDTVVCAAAEALNVPPPGVRPALLAAFRRAREAGLRVEDVERALRDVLEPKKAKSR